MRSTLLKTGLLLFLLPAVLSADTPGRADTPGHADIRGQADTPGPADRIPGERVGGGIVVRTGELIRPAGNSVQTFGKPVDVVPSTDGSLIFVKSAAGLDVIDADAMNSVRKLVFTKEQKLTGSMHGLAAVSGPESGSWTLYYTTTGKELLEIAVPRARTPSIRRKIALPGNDNEGIAVSRDTSRAYVCMSAQNRLGVVDLSAGKLVDSIPVGVAPYDLAVSPDGFTAYVTNYGGRHPSAGRPTEKSCGTDVEVDGRTIPVSATVSVVDLRAGKSVAEIDVGLHPTQIAIRADGTRCYVANANADSVSILDTADKRVVDTVNVRPDPALPFGSIPDAICLSGDEKQLYIANAGNDALAVVRLDAARPEVVGFIPTGWFPGGVTVRGKALFVANTRGGTVQRVPVPEPSQLDRWTKQVIADGQVPQTLLEEDRRGSGTPAVPVPVRPADPSVFRHVIYILKENKTYDQVFGDIGRGNSDPKLCVYGRTVTPNHHALADQFVLLDNYYCNGVNSSDGHQWATQGVVGDYFEKGSRTYDFGTDALCYAGSDFIWDSCLLHGLSVRNYGEFDFPTATPKTLNWFDVCNNWDKSGQSMFEQSVEFQTLKEFTCKQYPGWNLNFPDVCRTKVFVKELEQFERDGRMPAFMLIYLPQDHTAGTGQEVPTPRAMVADNDLATGRVVEAISKSRFWKDTVIFINEDDPQSGYDHVDGHRSFCLIASAYTKRGAVVSRFYNQTSVLHTMTRILGLPSLNQECAMSPTMEECFTNTPDFRPYTAIPNNIPLDERNKGKPAMNPQERSLSDAVDRMDFSRPDRIDIDTFNRLGWIAAGKTDRYPVEFSGPHGRGLAALHLHLADEDHDGDGD